MKSANQSRNGERPLARNTDPMSSRLAAALFQGSKRHQDQFGAVLKAVKAHPGCTSRELTAYGIERYTSGRRLSEIAAEGLVKRGPMRKCRISGRMCVTWWPK